VLKVSRLTDYGIGLMTCLARRESAEPISARDLATGMGLPLPTVSKVLKLLSGGELLVSTRGPGGGYALGRPPAEITLAEMFEALEGPMAVTDCADTSGCSCDLEVACGLKPNWNWINRQLLGTLRGITLQDMTGSIALDRKRTELFSLTPAAVDSNREVVS
jgi:FeS assembly SUF system regulator